MSLAALNAPPLVASAGIVAAAVLPLLENACSGSNPLPWTTVKILNSLFYGLNFYATSQPGRIDGVQQDEYQGTESADNKSRKAKELEAFTSNRQGKSLVIPSGWAFAIWGPIFLGELVFVSSSFLLDESSPTVAVIRKASGGFMISQVFQSLWAASFRPKYKGNLMYISSSMLTGIAYSLSRAHAAFAGTKVSTRDYILCFLPMAMHFGWTTAASLVNWNGNISMPENVNPRLVAWVGHLSAVTAAALGVGVTLIRQAPVFGGVIAWALTACGTGLNPRLQDKTADPKRAGMVGAVTQKYLLFAGAALSAAASIVTIIQK